jgi:hypothetical protein
MLASRYVPAVHQFSRHRSRISHKEDNAILLAAVLAIDGGSPRPHGHLATKAGDEFPNPFGKPFVRRAELDFATGRDIPIRVDQSLEKRKPLFFARSKILDRDMLVIVDADRLQLRLQAKNADVIATRMKSCLVSGTLDLLPHPFEIVLPLRYEPGFGASISKPSSKNIRVDQKIGMREI